LIATQNFKGEFFRKFIHISSSVIPLAYYFSDKVTILSILIPILVAMLLVEMLKYRVEFIYNIYVKTFSFMLKDHEVDRKLIRMNGASWVLLGDVFCILFFPKLIAITGMLILSLADSLSAVFGRLYGGKHVVPDRTIAGTLVFFIVSLIISFLTPKYFYSLKEYSLYVAMAAVTTIADFIKLPVDDNFAIPVISSGVLYVLYLIFFPNFHFPNF
jgi:dolichol kinase